MYEGGSRESTDQHVYCDAGQADRTHHPLPLLPWTHIVSHQQSVFANMSV